MKTLATLILALVLVGCNGGGGGGGASSQENPEINSLLESGSPWDTTFMDGADTVHDIIAVTGDQASWQRYVNGIQIYNRVYDLTPITNSRIQAVGTMDDFTWDYTVDATTLELCDISDGTCSNFTN
jgi:hypothetical protein